MYLDKRNGKKVVIERETEKGIAIVKNLSTGKRYIVEKKNLISLDKKQ